MFSHSLLPSCFFLLYYFEWAETVGWCNIKEKELTFWRYMSDLSLFFRQAVSATAHACVLHLGLQSITVWPI